MAPPVSADDLLVMLTVARLGRLTAAADALQVNHTTVARRIATLEKALGERVLEKTPGGWELTARGREVAQVAEQVELALTEVNSNRARGLSGMVRIAAPDGFATHFAAPAAASLTTRHPEVRVEIIAATQRFRQHRSGVDIDVVVGEPTVHRATAVPLVDYSLGLFASADYLARCGTPYSLAELANHPLCYYVESALQVDELDLATAALPNFTRSIRSTSVFVHLETTLLGAGIGILPEYMAARHPTLVPVLAGQYRHDLGYWAVVRQEAARSPLVHAAMDALHQTVRTAGTNGPRRTKDGATRPGGTHVVPTERVTEA